MSNNELFSIAAATSHHGLIPQPVQVVRDLDAPTVQIGQLEPEGEFSSDVRVALETLPYLCVRAQLQPLYVVCDPDLPAEGYRLEVAPDRIRISAADGAGAFYATITLAHLALIHSAHVPAQTIVDYPRYRHRGTMVDVARSFLTEDELCDLIDAAAAHKLNILHLHLVDDQGWRLEVTNEGRESDDDTDYTALHRVSGATACRAGDNPGFDAEAEAMTVVGDQHNDFSAIGPGHTGSYTQAQFRSLVAYARARHVQLIPELEFPGHNHSVLHALPHLATAGASTQARDADGVAYVEPWTSWQVGHSYLDFTHPDTWRFTRHILRQLYQLMGDQPIHLGGDEAHLMVRNLGVSGYRQAVNQVIGIAREIGFTQLTLWQEAYVLDVGEGDTIQFWTTVHGDNIVEGITQLASDTGCSIINSNASHAYLDQKISVDDPRGLTWACPQGLPTRTCYEWNPDEDFPQSVRSQIVGVEAPLWSETVRGIESACYLMFPRLAALAEVAWSPQASRTWSEFSTRL